MRLLVIGGSGFTGRRVLAACDEGWSVFGLARSDAAAASVRDGGAVAVPGDLDDPDSLSAALRTTRPDAVLCTASLGFGHAPTLVRSPVDAGGPFTVFTGTTAVFTRLEPATKRVRLAAEDTIARSGLPFTLVRPTMIYGRPGDRNMERLLRWLRRVPVVPAPGRGRSLQQPVHVDDLAATLVSAVRLRPEGGPMIDVPGPDPLSFAEIVRLAGAGLGRRRRIVPVPLGPLRAAVGLQERLAPRPLLRTEQIDRLVEDKVFDAATAIRVLGHDPRPFAVGIAEEARLMGLTRSMGLTHLMGRTGR